jgi:hypothetical protein
MKKNLRDKRHIEQMEGATNFVLRNTDLGLRLEKNILLIPIFFK